MVLAGKWSRSWLILCWLLFTAATICNYNWFDQLPNHSSSKGMGAICLDGIEGRIITATTNGRLGNQMYIYATMFAALERENRSRRGFMNPKMFNFISPYFQVSLPPLDIITYHQVNWTQLNIDVNYPTTISFLNEASCLRICCFPQQWELFDSIRDRIQQEFTFHDHIVQETERTISKIRSNYNSNLNWRRNLSLVGVHVRRTDYVAHATKILKLSVPELPFYEGAMKYMSQKYTNVVFIVTSDDIDYCKRLFAPIQNIHQIDYIEGRTKEQGGLDMALLSKCDHVIYGLGTFGFWAAYLNKGEVVYCACAKNTSMLKDYHKFVLPTWTGISVDGFKTR